MPGPNPTARKPQGLALHGVTMPDKVSRQPDRVASLIEAADRLSAVYQNRENTYDGLAVAIRQLITDYAVANGASVVVLIRADNEEPVELAVEFTPGPN